MSEYDVSMTFVFSKRVEDADSDYNAFGDAFSAAIDILAEAEEKGFHTLYVDGSVKQVEED